MKKQLYISLLLILATVLSTTAQTIERGSVKEYHGKEQKTALAGVELMIKGAQSTLSDADGSFTLHFATLSPGDKVDCTDIYKEGYVIFNKDALEAWRISNNQRPFTIIMCKESDFRSLKKKFHNIIENSYRQEYERQKGLAEKLTSDAKELESKLKKIETDYNEKLSNINTYVELFSRIDRSEMDSIESRSLDFVEQGKIDEAIALYEELHISRQVENQLSKFDAGNEMLQAAQKMVSESQNDLMLLVEKMQKQIGLYQMGGSDYDSKRRELIEKIIPLLYKLNQFTGGYYNETLGQMIIARSAWRNWHDRINDFREAASLPSAAGLFTLGDRMEMWLKAQPELTDSLRQLYTRALQLANGNDSLSQKLSARLFLLPIGTINGSDGNVYPFGLWKGDTEAYLCGYGTYVSAHIEGNAQLPDIVTYHGREYPVTAISKNAFLNNKSLKSVTLPANLRVWGYGAFSQCTMLDSITVNRHLEYIPHGDNLNTMLTLPHGTDHPEWIAQRLQSLYEEYPDRSSNANAKNALLRAIIDHYIKNKDKASAAFGYSEITKNMLAIGDTLSALKIAKEGVRLTGTHAEGSLANIYHVMGNYTEAEKHYSKAMKTPGAETLNQYAYLIMDPSSPLYDMAKARNLLQQALDLTIDDPVTHSNILDSMGELYLLQGDERQARAYMEKALEINPLLYKTTHSRLHDHFCDSTDSPTAVNQPTSAADNEPTDSVSKSRETNLRDYVNLITLIARNEHETPDLENYPLPQYEEALSIGIISMQFLIRDKTPEQLKKLPLEYIAAVVTHTLHAELAERYDWYNAATESSQFSTSINGVNKKQLNTIYCIYLTVRDLYYIVKENPEKYSEFIAPLEQRWDLFKQAREAMTLEQQEFMDFFMTSGSTVKEIEQRFGPTVILPAINIIGDTYRKNQLPGYGIGISMNTLNNDSTSQADSDTAKIDKQKLNQWLNLAKVVASIEQQKAHDVGLDVEYDECLSIAAIAIQVVIKNKTPEQIARYGTPYLASALSFAIRNELGITHNDYKLAIRKYMFTAPDPADNVKATKASVYHNIKEIYYTIAAQPDIFQSQPEIIEIMNKIEMARQDMPADTHRCADIFFSKESTPASIMESYSLQEISDMLDIVKKAL
ncbi:MAG: leucine-rich repeat protein [Clostridiales bacterium]|nr:leucine-rich repeat protein [Clostridiales bacterium]